MTELTNMQWGASGVTLHPSILNVNYTQATYTMADWGQYPLPYTPIAPEYFFWAQKAHGTRVPLTMTQVDQINGPGYSWFGMLNSYNSKLIS